MGEPGSEANPFAKIPGQGTVSRAEAEVGAGGGLTLAVGEVILSPSPASGRRRRWEQQWGCSDGWLRGPYVTCQGQLRAPSLLPPNLTRFPTTIRAVFSGVNPCLPPPPPAQWYVLSPAQLAAILCHIPEYSSGSCVPSKCQEQIIESIIE